jgi:plastocyanin
VSKGQDKGQDHGWGCTPVSRAILLVAAACVLLAGCSDGDSSGGPEHDTAARTVTINGFSFTPATITVQQGDTVIFHTTHNQVHTATLDSRERDTGDIAPGKEAKFTMPTMGTHRYHCAKHAQMTGTIVVTEP